MRARNDGPTFREHVGSQRGDFWERGLLAAAFRRGHKPFKGSLGKLPRPTG